MVDREMITMCFFNEKGDYHAPHLYSNTLPNQVHRNQSSETPKQPGAKQTKLSLNLNLCPQNLSVLPVVICSPQDTKTLI